MLIFRDVYNLLNHLYIYMAGVGKTNFYDAE